MSEEGRNLTVHGRIKHVINWLINCGLANSQEDVGKILGYENKSYFSQLVNGKVSLPSGFTYKLASIDKRINEPWISEGWGSMLINESTNINNSKMEQSQLIEQLRKQIDDLMADKHYLREENKELRSEIKELKSLVTSSELNKKKEAS